MMLKVYMTILLCKRIYHKLLIWEEEELEEGGQMVQTSSLKVNKY